MRKHGSNSLRRTSALANTRADFQHKLSRQLIDDNQAVVVETLKVKNMLKNRKLAKHIADASWHSLIQKLAYKADAQGKHLVKIDQWFASTKTCAGCGHKVRYDAAKYSHLGLLRVRHTGHRP